MNYEAIAYSIQMLEEQCQILLEDREMRDLYTRLGFGIVVLECTESKIKYSNSR